MKIKALQKLTLVDYPDKLACTIFLFGCNFRCPFCYNAGLVLKEDREDMPRKEILDFLKKRKKYLSGVCITGGEPLMTLDEEFLQQIKSLNYLIKIDTNGAFPEKIKQFVIMNLVDFVSMDIKSSKEKYKDLVGIEPNLNKIEESIKLVSLLPEYEFRTTIIPEIHTENEIKKISQWLNYVVGHKPKKFVLQGFKVKGELINKEFEMKKPTSEKYLEQLKNLIKDYFEVVEVRV